MSFLKKKVSVVEVGSNVIELTPDVSYRRPRAEKEFDAQLTEKLIETANESKSDVKSKKTKKEKKSSPTIEDTEVKESKKPDEDEEEEEEKKGKGKDDSHSKNGKEENAENGKDENKEETNDKSENGKNESKESSTSAAKKKKIKRIVKDKEDSSAEENVNSGEMEADEDEDGDADDDNNEEEEEEGDDDNDEEEEEDDDDEQEEEEEDNDDKDGKKTHSSEKTGKKRRSKSGKRAKAVWNSKNNKSTSIFVTKSYFKNLIKTATVQLLNCDDVIQVYNEGFSVENNPNKYSPEGKFIIPNLTYENDARDQIYYKFYSIFSNLLSVSNKVKLHRMTSKTGKTLTCHDIMTSLELLSPETDMMHPGKTLSMISGDKRQAYCEMLFNMMRFSMKSGQKNENEDSSDQENNKDDDDNKMELDYEGDDYPVLVTNNSISFQHFELVNNSKDVFDFQYGKTRQEEARTIFQTENHLQKFDWESEISGKNKMKVEDYHPPEPISVKKEKKEGKTDGHSENDKDSKDKNNVKQSTPSLSKIIYIDTDLEEPDRTRKSNIPKKIMTKVKSETKSKPTKKNLKRKRENTKEEEEESPKKKTKKNAPVKKETKEEKEEEEEEEKEEPKKEKKPAAKKGQKSNSSASNKSKGGKSKKTDKKQEPVDKSDYTY